MSERAQTWRPRVERPSGQIQAHLVSISKMEMEMRTASVKYHCSCCFLKHNEIIDVQESVPFDFQPLQQSVVEVFCHSAVVHP